MKNGLRIISTLASNSGWNLNFDVNGKHISASATIVRNFSVPAPNKRCGVVICHLFIFVVCLNHSALRLSDGCAPELIIPLPKRENDFEMTSLSPSSGINVDGRSVCNAHLHINDVYEAAY